MIKKVCYLDLDGVLVDFVSGVLKYHNRLDMKYEDLDWDFDKKLGLTPEEFWGPLSYDFWLNLGWTKEGKEILALVEKYFGENVAILTSPPKTPNAVQGKLDWIKREIPRYNRRVFVGARKELMAAPSKLLIDDRDENINGFEGAGGEGFLIGRPWNALKKHEHNIVNELETFLKYYNEYPPERTGKD